jgi:hypothetical protein
LAIAALLASCIAFRTGRQSSRNFFFKRFDLRFPQGRRSSERWRSGRMGERTITCSPCKSVNSSSSVIVTCDNYSCLYSGNECYMYLLECGWGLWWSKLGTVDIIVKTLYISDFLPIPHVIILLLHCLTLRTMYWHMTSIEEVLIQKRL